MNETENFLGDPSRWGAAVVELRSVHGLHGGASLHLRNDGFCLAQLVAPGGDGLQEERYRGELSEAEMLPAFLDSDFLSIAPEERAGEPDEMRIAITLWNSNRAAHTVAVWERATVSPDAYATSDRKRFDDLHRQLRKLLEEVQRRAWRIYSGPYQPDAWKSLVSRQTEVDALVAEGSILLSGGCEVYAEGEIRLKPRADGVGVLVSNRSEYGYFLTEEGESIETLHFDLTLEEAGEFIVQLREVLDSDEPSEFESTRDARVQVRLPLFSRTLEADWQELAGERDVDRLLEVIDAFVAARMEP